MSDWFLLAHYVKMMRRRFARIRYNRIGRLSMEKSNLHRRTSCLPSLGSLYRPTAPLSPVVPSTQSHEHLVMPKTSQLSMQQLSNSVPLDVMI